VRHVVSFLLPSSDTAAAMFLASDHDRPANVQVSAWSWSTALNALVGITTARIRTISSRVASLDRGV
jgi:hypothetical protein